MYNIKGLRTVSLLRVSSGKQTSKEEQDIPAQRQLVRDFIEQEELVLIREFVEGGISGFKTKADDRDALVTIKRMAKNHEFDVLVVYKSDRIGRISDESTLVVAHLNQREVRVFTTNDGEIKTNTQMDKLMTYLQFWQNETESVKLSERATDYQMLLVKEGRWRGGGKDFVPYGYKVVNNGSINSKGRNILDFVINEEEAEIIRKIYDWSVNYNMGSKAIAEKLNKDHYRTRNGKQWYYSTITSILNNVMYKGYFHMKSSVRKEEVLSPFQEHLMIIPETTWQLNQECIKKRSTYRDATVKGISQSKTLLSGLTYCGHCGNKLTSWSNYKTYIRKSGKVQVVQFYYRCTSSFAYNGIKCDGQTSYSCSRIDSLVEKHVKEFIMKISNKKLAGNFKIALEEELDKLINQKKDIENKLKELQSDYYNLKKDISKSLKGIGNYTLGLINEIIEESKKEQEELLQKVNEVDTNIYHKKVAIKNYNYIDTNIGIWIEQYDNADLIDKKRLLSKVINKVLVYRDSIDIEYSITINDFIENSEKNEVTGFASKHMGNRLP